MERVQKTLRHCCVRHFSLLAKDGYSFLIPVKSAKLFFSVNVIGAIQGQ
jgi:hypothetical protein